MNGMWAGLGRGGQLLVAGAALIFVGADLLGALLGGVGVSSAVSIPAALVLAFVYVDRTGGGGSWPFPYPIVQLVLTVIVVVFALEDFIATIKGSTFSQESPLDILILLAVWVGAAAMAVGWWMDWTARRRG